VGACPNKLLALLEAANLTSNDEAAEHPKSNDVGSDEHAPAIAYVLGMHARKMQRLSQLARACSFNRVGASAWILTDVIAFDSCKRTWCDLDFLCDGTAA